MFPGFRAWYADPISLVEKISGTILTRSGARQRAGLTIAEGRIVDVGEPDPAAGPDYGAALLLPGAVDVHVHTRSYADEGIERCTTAAAAGGVTTIVDMPYDAAGPIDSLDAFERKVADVGREAVIDVALWATVPPTGPLDQVQALVDAGAAAFKCSTFNTHPQRFPQIPDPQLLRAFGEIAQAGGMVGIHAENDELVRAGIAAEQAAGNARRPDGARALTAADRRERGDRAGPGDGPRDRRTDPHLPCHDAARRAADRPGPRRRRRRDRRDLPPLPAARRIRPGAARRRVQDQPAAARRNAARRRPRADLIRPRRLADRTKARPRHLRALLRRARRRADRPARARRARPGGAGPARLRAAREAVRAVAAQGRARARRSTPT